MSYEINDEFEPKSKRFAIQDDQSRQNENWNIVSDTVQNEIVEDRRGHVETIIVKVMKEDKELVHKELVSKVMPLLKFPQERKQVVERIESLIKRGFLEGYKKEPAPDGAEAMDVDDDPVETMLVKYVFWITTAQISLITK